ncbi:Methyltransferase [Operophtera brumata]|uniref:Methyltransferase n=1 Tax=Operophtera brumata TaxID=104452 RepID=A0A0L7L1G9_OPEBR|nr:Methyltransferase [Operophtera brumata]
MGANMKMKTLQGHLQQLSGFSNPKIELEQYETPPHIAAIALYTIQTQYEDIEGNLILDAGCGPGALSIGAALLGAATVLSVEIDGPALEVFKENIEEIEVMNVDALQFENYFDTVIMNPPFGTKNNAGMDLKPHVMKKIQDWGMKGSVIAELRYDLPATYKFHKRQTLDIAVDLWRVHHPHS